LRIRTYAGVLWLAAATLAGAAMAQAASTSSGQAASTGSEQAYPTRPMRIIVPFPPGGTSDLIARMVGQKLTEAWGQQAIVENRGGAGGNIGMGLAARATPDGYTMLLVSSVYAVNPSLYPSVPYDPYKSFTPVTIVATAPDVFVVHPSLGAKSMQELAKLVRSEGRKFSIATPGVGTNADLLAELFKITTKTDLVRVPYGGAGPAVASVVGNQVPIGCVALPGAVSSIKAGTLRALAVASTKRSASLPDVPTVSEAGFAGHESEGMQGLFVPAGTPKAIVNKINNEILRINTLPDVKARIAGFGYETVATTPEQFASQIKDEVAKWAQVVKRVGIKVE
jgi:tripartite-type tricarboxylate transporter receptor subunit TctC